MAVKHNLIKERVVQNLGKELILLPPQAQMVEKVMLGEMAPTAGPRFIYSANFETNVLSISLYYSQKLMIIINFWALEHPLYPLIYVSYLTQIC